VIPEGFEARPAAGVDVAEATALLAAFDAAHLDEVTDVVSEQDLRDWWSAYDLERDTRVLRESATGRLAALGLVEARADVLDLDGYVHPELAGRGAGGYLAAWAEAEGRARGSVRVRTGFLTTDLGAQRLFRERGYAYSRSFYRMVLDLDAPPPEPAWPAGFALSTREAGAERDFHAVLEEAFSAHWGHVPRPFDEWLERMVRDSPDPALWFIVRAGDEPAAAAVCAQRYGIGWIGTLGVGDAWRQRGLGRALLLHAFGELQARGESRIGLGVDATNETGAIRLYESVGMRVVWQADFGELALDS
jgi:mycothiol synthase